MKSTIQEITMALGQLKLPAIVLRVINELKADRSVREIWLIGSRANKMAIPTSDWDFLVRSNSNPKERSARCDSIDILWAGPSGTILLEGQTETFAFSFSDFQWTEIAPGIAQYVGRKFIDDIECGVIRDAGKPIQNRPTQRAIRVWCSYQSTNVL